MSSPAGTVRHRGPAVVAQKKSKDSTVVPGQPTNKQKDIRELDALVKANSKKGSSQWDYKLAITIITLLAFATRFWGISHPNEVVFDEVHFGKVRIGLFMIFHTAAKSCFCSSHLTTLSAHTSSMCTHRLASFSLPLWDISLATMEASTSTTLATRTLRTRFHMLHTAPCQL